jgi:hypothetical protein
MSKAIAGIAELGAAAALQFIPGAGTVLSAMMLAKSAIVGSLVIAGIGSEAGAIADALSQNRGQGITTRQPAAYRGIVYGTRQVPGVMVYQSTTGSSYDQYNMVIVLAGHPCYAIQNLYLDGRKVFWNVGSDGNTTQNGFNFGGSANSTQYIGPDGQHYNFGGLVYCKAEYGTQALGDVIGELTANDPNWATNSNGSPSLVGCTYVYLKIEYDTSMFPQFPEIRFTVSGNCNVYDPRTETYGFTENWALCVEVDVQVANSSIYEWSPSTGDELSIYDIPVANINPPYIVAPPTSMTLDSSAATAVVGADGVVIPRVLVSWTAPMDIAVTLIQIEYRVHGAANWTWWGDVEVGLFQAFVDGVIAGAVYDFQIRSLRANGASSAWVEEDSYTVSDTYSSIESRGINPNSPYNINNDATIDSVVDGDGTTADIRVYGPGDVGTSWDNYTGSGSATYPATTITGEAFTTTYYVVIDTTTGDYYALTDYNDSLSDNYLTVGSTTTIASGGTGGTTGGGTGGGSGGGGPRRPIYI